MDILEINVENQITQNWNVKIPLTASTAQENALHTYGNVKHGKKNNRNKIHKKYPSSRGQKNRTNPRTTSYAYVTKKKGNEEKEDTTQKQEELNKLINEVKNLIETLKTIIRDHQGTHFNSPR